MAESSRPPSGASKAASSSGKKPPHLIKRFPQVADEVAANKVWREFCEKLDCTNVEDREFSFNPNTTVPVTEKVTRVTPNVRVSKEEFKESKGLLDSLYPIKNLDVAPPDKYEVPLTTSQQIGWRSKELTKKPKFLQHPRHTCDVTEYAAIYFEAMRTTPFSKKGFVPRYVLKEQAAQKAAAEAAAIAAATPPPPPAPAADSMQMFEGRASSL